MRLQELYDRLILGRYYKIIRSSWENNAQRNANELYERTEEIKWLRISGEFVPGSFLNGLQKLITHSEHHLPTIKRFSQREYVSGLESALSTAREEIERVMLTSE